MSNSRMDTTPDNTTNSSRKPFTLNTFEGIRLVREVELSPDGKQIAFVVWEVVDELPKRRPRVWIVDTEGGEPRPLTKSKRGDFGPRWSPDSWQVAFISNGEEEKDKPQLFVIAADGGDARRVCMMPNGVSDVQWAPDGKRIAFISRAGKEPEDDPKVFTPQQDRQARHHRLWTVRPDYDTPEPVTPDGVSVWEYTWSPDSQQIALYYAHGSEDTDWYHSSIGIVPANGGAVREVKQFRGRQAAALAWSPDSLQLAFISGAWSDPGRGSGDIFLLNREDGQARNLTPGIDCSPSWLCWLPDGRHLLFTANKGVTHQIGLLNATDGVITLLADDVVMQGDQPILSPTPDRRRFATIVSHQQGLFDVWFGERGNTENALTWRQITRLNPIAEETLGFARSERIRYQSIDGVWVDALFTPPLNYEGHKPPPLYVSVHGGPSGSWSDDYGSSETQILASAGYAVLRTNYRGSWGQGVAFADAVLGDMGGKDLQDILYGVDYLAKQGKIDDSRVAIGGWSNGGYLAAWAVTQTTRFKAAMMGAGISDWHNMHAQTNIADADMLLLAADPLERPEVYRERSPITFAGRVTTPTLIAHGEKDPAVPVAQAYAFYRALCERNVPVELVVYPREGHGLGEREHARDYQGRLLRWLKQYV